MTECFMIEPTNLFEESLRRFVFSSAAHSKCPHFHGYHNASVVIGQQERSERFGYGADDFDHTSPLWPKACACGYVFHDDDEWQHNLENLFRDTRDGSLYLLRDAPPGAMYYAWWLNDTFPGPDGQCLAVILPNKREWLIDSVASNCTMPEDKVHRCWVREGTPPKVTVSKNGLTCGAGAGSILAGDYHGFLQNGFLT